MIKEMTSKKLFDGDHSIDIQLERDGKVLLITFGGIAQGIGIPRFEFQRITSKLPAKLVLVRDLSQSWYHGPLPGVGCGVYDLAKRLEAIKNSSQCRKVVCLGNSMGGYAALLLGSMIHVDEVLAFSPQTFISKWQRLIHRDYRWQDQISHTKKLTSSRKEFFDLKSSLSKENGYRKATIFVDSAHRLDSIHARRLSQIPNTYIKWCDGGHGLVKKFRDSGNLESLLLEVCTPNEQREP